jgi:hypothetical protein
MTTMRVLVLVALMAGCGGGESTPDSGPSTCVPEGYWEWPADCSVALCGAQACDATCPVGATCDRLDCTTSPQCRIECQDQAHCPDIDCRGSDFCFVTCLGTGTTGGDCTMHGAAAAHAEMECLDSAQCLLDCGAGASATACKISNCTGGTGITDCGGGVYVCNRACP